MVYITDNKGINFLLNEQFVIERGYSYIEILNYLKSFQYYYRECYRRAETIEQEFISKNKTIKELENRIVYLENKVKEKEKETDYLYNKLNKNLSLWERIKGRIIIKY